MTNATTPDGMILKLERVTARVTGRDIARKMGVSPSRIGHVEGSFYVTAETASRYRAALSTCIAERTSAAIA